MEAKCGDNLLYAFETNLTEHKTIIKKQVPTEYLVASIFDTTCDLLRGSCIRSKQSVLSTKLPSNKNRYRLTTLLRLSSRGQWDLLCGWNNETGQIIRLKLKNSTLVLMIKQVSKMVYLSRLALIIHFFCVLYLGLSPQAILAKQSFRQLIGRN